MRHFFAILLLALSAATAGAAFVDTITVPSRYLDTPMKVSVVVPDGATPGSPVPVVYILNGFGGDYSSWLKITRPDLPELADRYGMMLVMPDGRDSWYWDSPRQPGMQMETFITRELVPYIDTRYPTQSIPSKRAITGLSMGGHGALYLASRHPDIWGSAGSMSGGVDIRPFPKSWKMAERLGSYEENPEVWNTHTVTTLLPALGPGKLNITIDCGVDDFFAGVNRSLHQALLDAGVPHDYTERPGRHSHQYWANSILYHLLFFNEAFSKQ